MRCISLEWKHQSKWTVTVITNVSVVLAAVSSSTDEVRIKTTNPDQHYADHSVDAKDDQSDAVTEDSSQSGDQVHTFQKSSKQSGGKS